MKARLVPLYFSSGKDSEFDKQLQALRKLLSSQTDILEPVRLGDPLPPADAVLFPQILGEAYRRLDDFKAITLPILIITTPAGTLSMWDWEIIDFLRAHDVQTIAPYDPAFTCAVCQALAVRRELRETRFLVFQDDPGEGFQAEIFKRFYWWEDRCSRLMKERFGVVVEKRSYRELGAQAKAVSDSEADLVWSQWQIHTEALSEKAIRSAVKLYIAIHRHVDQDPSIRGVGINCLNESQYCDTTPCLAWNRLFEERGILWACEADTMSLLTKYVLHKSTGTPTMMTNLYPFLLGDAAVRHERIEHFPAVDDHPENHILVAHCGYMGVIPTSFASDWTLRPKVLAIVDANASAIDARLPQGPVTLAKLHADMTRMSVAEGEIVKYVQFPGSDCLNGGVIRVRDGHKLMNSLASHHYLLMTGHNLREIRWVGKVFGLRVEEI